MPLRVRVEHLGIGGHGTVAEEGVEVGGAEQARAEEPAETVESDRVAAEIAGAELDAVDPLVAHLPHVVEHSADAGLVDAEVLAVVGVERGPRPGGELHQPLQEFMLRGRRGSLRELEIEARAVLVAVGHEDEPPVRGCRHQRQQMLERVGRRGPLVRVDADGRERQRRHVVELPEPGLYVLVHAGPEPQRDDVRRHHGAAAPWRATVRSIVAFDIVETSDSIGAPPRSAGRERRRSRRRITAREALRPQ
jgi:hypothetical protein